MDQKQNLYEKVKFVIGDNFITIEETGRLTDQELCQLTDLLVSDKDIQQEDNLTILVNSARSAEVEKYLESCQFKFHDERIFVRFDLSRMGDEAAVFTMKSLREVSVAHFKDVWQRSMEGSLNAAPYLSMDEQIESVKKELGSSYIDTCNVAYENKKAIGVVMPHIEPGTENEGRMFYFGLVPEARGQGKGSVLYRQGLDMLKKEFGALYSVGATSVNNHPMLSILQRNGCEVTETIKLFKRSNRGGFDDSSHHN
ncbi:GNAT family N-acetyltransferase [Halobacillus halophilus]|uniref:GNAT family N-acetyltransferase n=1 Tax=Halobacillus halophilus TaxID=1570 RepID=UPI001CD45D50|nr:GNAT family N-acetyltransferase [Halobacillus halophilus]MCA1012748.1 GNAT family N-acetyltransferase [Halobacillus halophilus]